jgi:hypothetical protein
MKRLFVLLTLIACACVDNQVQQQAMPAQAQHVGPAKLDRSSKGRFGPFYTYYNDWSNTVHVVIAEEDGIENSIGAIGADLPPGYVLIGGGAYTSQTEAGGYIQNAYPSPGSYEWPSLSHDHQVADTHTLTTYSVGLMLDGVSQATLYSYVSVVSSNPTGMTAVHAPTATSPTIPAGNTLIGGGARVFDSGGQGNFLTYSYPVGTGNAWTVGSKDINVSSLATIQAFAISIPGTIPGFTGQLEVSTSGPIHHVIPGSGYDSAGYALPSGWVPACVGAVSFANTNGRPIVGLRPPSIASPNQFKVKTKDCMVASGGYIDLYAFMIRKKP